MCRTDRARADRCAPGPFRLVPTRSPSMVARVACTTGASIPCYNRLTIAPQPANPPRNAHESGGGTSMSADAASSRHGHAHPADDDGDLTHIFEFDGDANLPDESGATDPVRMRLREGSAWRKWGPYLSERQWGTVRE